MAIIGATTDRKNYWVSKVLPRLDLVKGWARYGLTNSQIADNLGIGRSTFGNFAGIHLQLKETLRSAREDAEVLVENALFKRALGYAYREVTRERVWNEDRQDYEMATTKSVTKQVAADVVAIQYWLEHRAPKRWEKVITPDINTSGVNSMIVSLAELISRPVKVRKVGSEEDEYQED